MLAPRAPRVVANRAHGVPVKLQIRGNLAHFAHRVEDRASTDFAVFFGCRRGVAMLVPRGTELSARLRERHPVAAGSQPLRQPLDRVVGRPVAGVRREAGGVRRKARRSIPELTVPPFPSPIAPSESRIPNPESRSIP